MVKTNLGPTVLICDYKLQ